MTTRIKSFRISEQNRRIYDVLEQRTQPQELLTVQESSSAGKWYRFYSTAVEWLAFSFLPPCSGPKSTLRRFTDLAEPGFPDRLVSSTVHTHAYLLILARDRVSMSPEEILPIVLQALPAKYRIDSIRVWLLQAAQSS